MNAQTQAVLFNAVPLLVVAALYAAVTATLAPAVRSEWRLARRVDLATALMYPLVGTAAAILGVETLVSKEPVAGNVWVSVVPIALAAVPPLLFFANWRNRALAVSGGRRALEAEQGLSAREQSACWMPSCGCGR